MTLRVQTFFAIAPALAALALATAPGAAEAASRKPVVTALRCVPATAKGCRAQVRVTVGGQLQIKGRQLFRGMRVSFRWETGALATTLAKKKAGWIVRVPAGTRPGQIAVTVRDRAGRRSNVRHIQVQAKVVIPRTLPKSVAPGEIPDVFRDDGMWIWTVSKSEAGDPAAIGARAKAAGIETVFVKSADGSSAYDQFSSALIAGLKAQGLRVCAWQYVLGKHPEEEAAAAIAGIQRGADCFVIDAETEYANRYAQAQTYMNALRAGVGEGYPIGFTSFPYVHYHTNVPYSVFLGPGGAQVNMPQVYWKAIKDSVDEASAITMMDNRIYRVPIAPIGQSYDAPSDADVQRFRQVWAGYGSAGLSWWSWQASAPSTWTALGQPVPSGGDPLPDPGWPTLKLKSKGDPVVWLQQHIASFDPAVPIDGDFGPLTDQAIKAFQTSKALPATGVTDAATWQALLSLPVRAVDWSAS